MSMKVSRVDTVTAYSETDSHEMGMDRKFYGSHAKLVREGIFSPENHGDWKDRTSFLSKKFTSDNDKSGLSFSMSEGASAEGDELARRPNGGNHANSIPYSLMRSP